MPVPPPARNTRRTERGDALIEGLLALVLVLLVVAFAAQAIAYVQARDVAEAAAQDGASAAASGGTQAGIARATAILQRRRRRSAANSTPPQPNRTTPSPSPSAAPHPRCSRSRSSCPRSAPARRLPLESYPQRRGSTMNQLSTAARVGAGEGIITGLILARRRAAPADVPHPALRADRAGKARRRASSPRRRPRRHPRPHSRPSPDSRPASNQPRPSRKPGCHSSSSSRASSTAAPRSKPPSRPRSRSPACPVFGEFGTITITRTGRRTARQLPKPRRPPGS